MNKNIFWYMEQYKDKSIDEFPLNEVDALIFSELACNNYSTVLKKFTDHILTSDIDDNLLEVNKEGKGISRDNGHKVLLNIRNKKRYENIIIKHYEYSIGDDYQFGAISIIIPNKYIYIIFQGTDATISGWKENFSFSYKYPTKSQYLAGKYVNKVLTRYNLPCVIAGHSKGGNLALVAAMNTVWFKKNQIEKIYSFDGPGLKDREFASPKYQTIKDKLINIIPEQSLFGVLLNQENVITIRSRDSGIMQHSALNWQIEQDKFIRGYRSNISIKLSQAIDNWLKKYNDDKRQEITQSIFNIFEENGIKTLPEIKNNKLKILNIIKSSINISSETKSVLLNCLQVLIGEISLQVIDDGKKKIINKTNESKYPL